MRKLVKKFLLVVLLGSVGLVVSCKEETPAEKKPLTRSKMDPRSADEIYPFKRPLTNEQGKTIDAIVIGKTDSEVMIRTKMKGKTFNYQINSLAADDQEFLATLPNGDFGKIERLQMDISDLERSIKELRAKMDNKLSNPKNHSQFADKIRDYNAELNVLKKELENATAGDGSRKRRR